MTVLCEARFVLQAGPEVRNQSSQNKVVKTMIGGFHVDDSTYRSGGVVAGSAARLALQQIVGLLPEWRTGPGGRGLTCVASGRSAVKAGRLDQFSEAGAFVL